MLYFLKLLLIILAKCTGFQLNKEFDNQDKFECQDSKYTEQADKLVSSHKRN